MQDVKNAVPGNSFEKQFNEEVKRLRRDSEDIMNFRLNRSISVIEGPSSEFSTKLLALHLMDPSARGITGTVSLSKSGDKTLARLIHALDLPVIIIPPDSRRIFPELSLLSGDNFLGEESIKEFLFAVRDVKRNLLSKAAFGKGYEELKGEEKYKLILDLFRSNFLYYTGFNPMLTVPSRSEYTDLIDQAKKLSIGIRDDESVKTPQLDVFWDRFEGEQAKSFLNAFVDYIDKLNRRMLRV